MKLGTKEHRDMLAAFEKYMKAAPIRCRFEKEPIGMWRMGHRWQTGGGAAGAPSVLVAYGEHADHRLMGNGKIAGHYVANKPNGFTGL